VKTGPFFMHPIYVCGCGRSLARSKESLSAQREITGVSINISKGRMPIRQSLKGDIGILSLTWSQVNVIISFNIEIRIIQCIGSLKEG
jgi:hypothetical protein